MKIIAVADLGGLGSKEGPALAYTWVPPSLLPFFVPWLAILLLFAVRGNRSVQAWWVFGVLALAAILLALLPSSASSLNSTELELFRGMISGLIFGVAALWLLSHLLAWKHRMLAFLGCLVTLAGFGFLTFLMEHASDSLGFEVMYGSIVMALGALSVACGLTLAGLVCRRRYGAVRVALFSFLGVAFVWALVMVPIFALAVIASGASAPIPQFLGGLGLLVLITAGSLLPFLLLSFLNPWHRARLQGLLHLGNRLCPLSWSRKNLFRRRNLPRGSSASLRACLQATQSVTRNKSDPRKPPAKPALWPCYDRYGFSGCFSGYVPQRSPAPIFRPPFSAFPSTVLHP